MRRRGPERLIGFVLCTILFSLTGSLSPSLSLAQSGYEIINGTRVFTVVDQAAGVATFSNDCGSQTLTQTQLQQGAIPTDIIPCPRPQEQRSAPEPTPLPSTEASDSRQLCTNGQRCNDGYLCTSDNRCLSLQSDRYCGGRRACAQGQACVDNNTHCVADDDPRYCGNRRYCPQGEVCADNNSGCISSTDPRYCGGRTSCAQGQACVDDNTNCISQNDPRYCGEGHYCEPGNVCLPGHKCGPAPGASDEGMSNRPLTSADCKCISVLPIVPGVEYKITNSCGAMFVAVLFTGDILQLSPNVTALSSWARLGEISAGTEATAKPPEGWTIVSIGAVALRNKGSAITCNYVNGALPD